MTMTSLQMIYLNGDADGMALVMPVGDPRFAELAGSIRKTEGLPIGDGFFHLHPDLPVLRKLYDEGSLIVVPAGHSGHTGRSHEGAARSACYMVEDGVAAPSDGKGFLTRLAEAIGQSMIIRLRDARPELTVGPVSVGECTGRVDFHRGDSSVVERLAPTMRPEDMPTLRAVAALADLTAALPKTATTAEIVDRLSGAGYQLYSGGINAGDTHSAQDQRVSGPAWDVDSGAADEINDLVYRFRNSAAWADGVMILFSGMGRTAKENGDGGTDHGHATTYFILGGKVNGGRILGAWPGLEDEDLVDGKFLRPTVHLWSILAGLVMEMFGLSEEEARALFLTDEVISIAQDLLVDQGKDDTVELERLRSVLRDIATTATKAAA